MPFRTTLASGSLVPSPATPNAGPLGDGHEPGVDEPNMVSVRSRLGRRAHLRGLSLVEHDPDRGLRWLAVAAWLAPSFGDEHRDFIRVLRDGTDRWRAVQRARDLVHRFADSADAWLLLGESYLGVYRQPEALAAFEQALAIEERAEAAFAAGGIYRRLGRHADAAARFARAHAAGWGPDALLENARSLSATGERQAAAAALDLWASLVPGGSERVAELREELGLQPA
jgi:tetratricopeptide (TPR) repeat protein